MKFVAVSTNTKDVSQFMAAEFQRVEELRAAGTITGGWAKADFSGAAEWMVENMEFADEALAVEHEVLNERVVLAVAAPGKRGHHSLLNGRPSEEVTGGITVQPDSVGSK